MIQSSTKNEGWGGIGSLSGVVGTTSNSDISPNYPTIEGDGDNEYYYQNSITVNRLVNTEIRQLEKNGYSVDRITAAITVDQINMLEADKEQLREVIAFAIGTDIANVTVANYPFVINGGNSSSSGNNIIRGGNVDWTVYIIILLGLFVLALLIIAILTGNAKKKKRARAKAKAAAAQAAAAQAAQESAALSFEPQPQPDEEFNIQHLDDYDDESKSAVLKKEIKEFSHTNPDVVAQLIRSMMRNGD